MTHWADDCMYMRIEMVIGDDHNRSTITLCNAVGTEPREITECPENCAYCSDLGSSAEIEAAMIWDQQEEWDACEGFPSYLLRDAD